MKTIGVFFGGKNPEHDVSVITGQLIISGLKKLGHPVVPVFIGTDGRWYAGERLGELKFFTAVQKDYKGLKELTLDLEESRGKMMLRTKGLGGRAMSIDIAFPAIHGQYGEDGTLQGLFEMLDVPYVGCGVAASALSMDKVLTKLVYQAAGIPTTRFIHFSRSEWKEQKSAILGRITKDLTWPLFVKPARLGSSIGISKARTASTLVNAIEVALHYDTKALVEESVENMMDVTCAVIGHSSLTPSLLQESSYETDFLSYDDKYLKEGGTQLGGAKKSVVIPASLDAATTKEIQEIALKVYRLFELSGIARVDFLYDTKARRWFANELNTMPGTLYHHLWKESGIELPELLTHLLASAEEKRSEAESVTHTFASKLMDLARSTKLRIKGS
jgi:D-alanine-D-alanine ligase